MNTFTSRLMAACLLAGGCIGGSATARTIDFAGQLWDVRDSGGERTGPGPNVFSASEKVVYVDGEGALHLNVAKRHMQWTSTEVIARRSLGYGTYRFDVGPDAANIADNVVLGLFTYDGSPTDNHREVDIELSRWGDGRADNLQCAVQPSELHDHRKRFPLMGNGKGWIMEFTWLPGSFDCQVTDNDTGQIIGFGHIAQGVPQAGNERIQLNLWLFRGGNPLGEKASGVTVRHFSFTPR